MILYHGSTDLVEVPEIRKSEAYLDFGFGFYTTSSYAQAERWAKTKMRRSNALTGYVSVYSFDLEAAEKDCIIQRFDHADEAWLQFVIEHRQGLSQDADCDMHIGPVADDNVYRTIRLFETGVYDAAETVKRLKTEALQDQWVLHSEKILSYVTFTKAVMITEG